MSRRRTSRAFRSANTDPYSAPGERPQPRAYILPPETSPDPETHRSAQPTDRWIVRYRPTLGVWNTHPRPIGVWATPTQPSKFFATLEEAGDYARSRTTR